MKMLPYTTRYVMNEYGEIFDEGKRLSIEIIDGRKTVKMDWVHGVTHYDLAIVVVIVFCNVGLPTSLWDNIVPLFEDKDVLNVFPSNLSYRFSKPVEVQGYPGFFHVPFYSNLGITRDGVLINHRTKHQYKWTVMALSESARKKNVTGGYLVCGATRDLGIAFISRHCAIYLTFGEYSSNPWKLVINHKNGIPGDDWLENLELVTRAQNNKHAIESGLTPNSVIPILMKDLETNKVTTFKTISAASEGSGLSWSTVSRRATKNSHVRFPDGLLFKVDDGQPWPELTMTKNSTFVRQVAARNVFTGEIVICSDAADACNATGVNRASIWKQCKERPPYPICGFNYRYADSDLVWPRYTKKHLEIFRDHPKEAGDGILVVDKEGNEIAFYTSSKKAALSIGKSQGMIFKYVQGGYTPDGNIWKWYKITENMGPLDE